MTTLHVTNPLNVEATLNQWFSANMSAITRPSWLTFAAQAVVFNVPETGIATPCFSVNHIPVGQYVQHMGKQPGDRAVGLMEVNAWVSRRVTHWNAQIKTMDGMVRKVFCDFAAVQLVDYLTDPNTPTAQPYKVNLMGLESVPVMPDPNPDIERRRFLIRYQWTQQR
jgi:hypothetical protein